MKQDEQEYNIVVTSNFKNVISNLPEVELESITHTWIHQMQHRVA